MRRLTSLIVTIILLVACSGCILPPFPGEYDRGGRHDEGGGGGDRHDEGGGGGDRHDGGGEHR